MAEQLRRRRRPRSKVSPAQREAAVLSMARALTQSLDLLRLRGVTNVRHEQCADPQSRKLHAPGGAEEESQEAGVPWLKVAPLPSGLKRRIGRGVLHPRMHRNGPRLIERALTRDLPARIEELQKKKKEPHIPWHLGCRVSKHAESGDPASALQKPRTRLTEVLREHLDQELRAPLFPVSPAHRTSELCHYARFRAHGADR